jgi:hypothetical protein
MINMRGERWKNRGSALNDWLYNMQKSYGDAAPSPDRDQFHIELSKAAIARLSELTSRTPALPAPPDPGPAPQPEGAAQRGWLPHHRGGEVTDPDDPFGEARRPRSRRPDEGFTPHRFGNYGNPRGGAARATESTELALATPLAPLPIGEIAERTGNEEPLREFVGRMPRLLEGLAPGDVLAALRDPAHPARPAVLGLVAGALGGVNPADLVVERFGGGHKMGVFFFADRRTEERLAVATAVDIVGPDGLNGMFPRELKGFGAVAAAVRRAGYDGRPLIPELLDAGVVGALPDGNVMGLFVTPYGGRTVRELLDDVVHAPNELAGRVASRVLRDAFRAAGATMGTVHRISATPLTDPHAGEIPPDRLVSARLDEIRRLDPDLSVFSGMDDLVEMIARARAMESDPALVAHLVASLTHSDPILDNVVVDRYGHAWLVDLENMGDSTGADALPLRVVAEYTHEDEPGDWDHLVEGHGSPLGDVEKFVLSSRHLLDDHLGWSRTAELHLEFAAGYEDAWPEVAATAQVPYVRLLSYAQDLWHDVDAMRLRGGNPDRLDSANEALTHLRRLLGLA